MKITLQYLFLVQLCLLLSCAKKDSDNITPGSGTAAFQITGFSPASAKIGTEITITGKGFGTDMNDLAGVIDEIHPLTIISVTDTKMVVNLPVYILKGGILEIRKVIKTNIDVAKSKNELTLIQSWSQMTSFKGGARSSGIAFTIGDKGYVGLGQDATSYKNDLWEFDPKAGTWTQKAAFPGTGRSDAVAFAIGNKGYAGFGNDGVQVANLNESTLNDFYQYDPATNAWTKKNSVTVPKRAGAVGFSIKEKGYVGTGQPIRSGKAGIFKDFWEYNPANDAWTRKADLPGKPRHEAFGLTIKNVGYIGGGMNYTGSTYQAEELDDFYAYNPDTDKWTQQAKVLFTGTGSCSFSINDKGYVGLYYDSFPAKYYNNNVFEFSPDSNAWKEVAIFMGAPTNNAIGFAIGTTGYMGTGYGSPFGTANNIGNFNHLWAFNP